MENSLTFIQSELEKARERLKGVEDSIKKNIGRTVTSPPNRNVTFKRRISEGMPGDVVEAQRPRLMTDGNARGRGGRLRPNLPARFGARNPEERISAKKRLGEQVAVTVFSRLSGPPKDDDYDKKEESVGGGRHEVKITSHVVQTQDVPSRKEVLAAQAGDNQCRARNKRMFGALLGTLHKFRQEENQLKEKEQKRAQVEKKLEDAAMKEKEDMKKKRQELFLNRRQQQFEIKQLEFKLMRLKQLTEWEATRKHLLNFIQTKTSPKIFWHPKLHTDKTEKLLEETKKSINRTIEAKRAEVEKSIADHRVEQKVHDEKNDSNSQKRDEIESTVVTVGGRRPTEDVVVERSEEIQIPHDFVLTEDIDDEPTKEELTDYKNHQDDEEEGQQQPDEMEEENEDGFKEGHPEDVSMVESEIPLPKDEPNRLESNDNGELHEVNGRLSQPSP